MMLGLKLDANRCDLYLDSTSSCPLGGRGSRGRVIRRVTLNSNLPTYLASKALTTANALRSLGNTVQGVNPYLMRQAVIACALREVYYGAETWWPGYSHPGPRTGSILN
jgi:hypothetical protein